jgi:NADP-dependent 3-hydroxy acid dehydrogenase YdfG
MSLVTPQSCDAWRRKASVILRPSGIIRAYHPYALDITDSAQVAAAATTCADVSVLINNAGVMRHAPRSLVP